MKLVFVVCPPPSVTMRTIVVMPLYTATGVRVTVQCPCESGPVNTIPSVCTKAVLLAAQVSMSDASGVRSSTTVKGNATADDPMLMA